MTQLSDELLIAYVDGQLDKPQAAAVGRLAHENPELAERIARFRYTQARFVDTFRSLLSSGSPEWCEVAPGLELGPTRSEGILSRNSMIASAVAILGVSLVTGLAFFSGEKTPAPQKVSERLAMLETVPGWQAEVAKLHSFFSRDTLALAAQGKPSRELISMQLGEFVRTGKGAVVPDFKAHGLELARSQVLNYHGSRFLQISYLGKEEQPVALYVMAGGSAKPAEDGGYENVRTVHWEAGGASFVIAGHLPQEAMRALAVVAQNQMTPRP